MFSRKEGNLRKFSDLVTGYQTFPFNVFQFRIIFFSILFTFSTSGAAIWKQNSPQERKANFKSRGYVGIVYLYVPRSNNRFSSFEK